MDPDSFVDLFGKVVRVDEIPEVAVVVRVSIEYGFISYRYSVPNLRAFVQWYRAKHSLPCLMMPPRCENVVVDSSGGANESKLWDERNRPWTGNWKAETRQGVVDRKYIPDTAPRTRQPHPFTRGEKEKGRNLRYAMTTVVNHWACRESLPHNDKSDADEAGGGDVVRIYGTLDDQMYLSVNLPVVRFKIIHRGFLWKRFYFWKRFACAFKSAVRSIIYRRPIESWIMTDFCRHHLPVPALLRIVLLYWSPPAIGVLDLATKRPANLMTYANDDSEDDDLVMDEDDADADAAADADAVDPAGDDNNNMSDDDDVESVINPF